MPKFSANLSMLFGEFDFLDRFDAAADAGFTGVEYVSPYDHAPDVVAARLGKCELTQALFNLPAGNWDGGERGIAILPGRLEEFRRSVDTAIRYAKALGCENVNCLAGIAPAGSDHAVLKATLVENLKFAAPRFQAAGVKLLIEAINPIDIPGFFLNTSAQAIDIIDSVGSDNLYFQYDIYHMQKVEGELARTLLTLLPRIAHVQIADNPGRHEPGTGEINYPYLFRHLDRIGYTGWVGAEYRPLAGTAEGLGWLRAVDQSGDAA